MHNIKTCDGGQGTRKETLILNHFLGKRYETILDSIY